MSWQAAACRRHATWSRVLLAIVLLVGCGGGPDGASAEDEVAITTTLGAYLPRLAEAYRSGNLAVLQNLASEKEIAELDKRISDLAAEGREVRPELRSFEVEDINIWSHSNAFVTTIEVWDLSVFATGTEEMLSQAREQSNRVKYQLKRRETGWLVLYREIVTTF